MTAHRPWLGIKSANHRIKSDAPHARSGGRRAGSSAGPRRGTSRGDMGEVRAWAKSNGHQASDRGRVSAAVHQAYDAAHKRVIG
jgi:hypothetical protein